YSMNAYMNAAAEKWEAGQAVRLPSIPAATKYGIYENLHEFSDGATLSEHLQAATQSQHGAAGREWIKQLANTPTERVQAALNAFMTTLPSLDGQARRVAKRFALV
ncbi:helicase, partial [Kingella kingae]|nr:helicase [Kingella kingae]